MANDQGDRVVLLSGEEIRKVDQSVHLGVVFHRHLDVMSVLCQRLGQAQSIMRKLQLFWKANAVGCGKSQSGTALSGRNYSMR